MGGKGRAPRSSHLRALEGVRPCRLNFDEPVPSDGLVVPPVTLPADAQAVWDRLAPDMIARRVLTAWDVDMFSVFCRSAALFNRAAAEVEKSGLWVEGSRGNTVVNPHVRVMVMMADMMRSVGQRFGLTPGDRATLRIEPNSASKSTAARLLT